MNRRATDGRRQYEPEVIFAGWLAVAALGLMIVAIIAWVCFGISLFTK